MAFLFSLVGGVRGTLALLCGAFLALPAGFLAGTFFESRDGAARVELAEQHIINRIAEEGHERLAKAIEARLAAERAFDAGRVRDGADGRD